ncbi:hypothetical protein [Alteribacillus sp. HJP-4]|uniref:hypothetical protein n=1 Tax=Alteribacillus sp. HJP-4 TaxID=2775394 RepID=UPI0035CCF5AC
MINILTFIFGTLTIIFGFINFNNEPSFLLSILFGGSLILFFIFIGIRDWKIRKERKTGA